MAGASDSSIRAGSGRREDEHRLLAGLGPEPLDDTFSVAVLDAALAGKRTPIKAALLDQKIVAGLGNIYVCEALFRAGISPLRLAASVPGARSKRLVPAIRQTLTEAIAAGGSSLRDYVQPDGELGYFQHAWKVYGREGEPCPVCPRPPACDGVRRIVQSGRSTFYCPRTQR
jgi:formamidopyrimidine-DNA glycosylase